MKDSTHITDTAHDADARSGLFTSPVITEIYNDSGTAIGPVIPGRVTDDPMPRFTGTAAPGSLVEIFSWSTKLGEGYADENGRFSFVSTTPFAAGGQLISAKSTQSNGDEARSEVISLSFLPLKHPVDPDQPVNLEPTISRPVIEGIYDNRSGEKLIENGFTVDKTPLLKGTADPLAIVYVTNFFGQPVGSIQASAEGEWELEVDINRGSPFKAIAVDAENPANVSYRSELVHLRLQSESAPLIESVYDNVGATGYVDQDGVTDDPQPVISGTADPHSLVEIFLSGTSVLLGQGYADENGHFSFTITEPLASGSNTFYAISSFDGVSSPPSDPFSLTYTPQSELPDTFIPPYALQAAIDEPANDVIGNDGTTTDVTPTLTGKANAFATVIIRINDIVVDEVVANKDGIWIFEPKAPLSPGLNIFSFAAMNNGVEQISEASFTLNIALRVSVTYADDNVGLDIGELSAGQSTDDSQPTLHGAGTPNAIVLIRTERGLLGSVQVNENGEWSFTPESPLAPGVHRFRPIITHPDSDQPVSGDYFALTITTPVSLTPEILYARDDQGYSSWLDSGDTTDDATPTFTGYVDAPGRMVMVRDGGNVIGSIKVDPFGDWIYTPEPALETGSHSLTFEIVDLQGKVHASEPFVLQVVLPTDTKILYADDNVGSVTDALSNGGRTDDTTPTLHGSGTPNSTVNIYYKGRLYLGSAEINADGKWSFTPSSPLPAGSYDFTAREVNGSGQEQPASPNFSLTIAPPIEYFAPTISNVYDNVLTQKYLSNGSITDDTTPRFSGRGTPNSTIEVRDNDKVIAEVPVDRYGNWSWTATQPLETGDYRFSFVTVGEDGREYASADFNLEIITQVGGRITSAEDNVGAVTDPLSSGSRTDDTTPTLNGVGTPDGIVRIYDNNRLIGSAKINESGEWSFTPSSALAAGAHNFYAKVTGPDGTVLANSPNFALTIAPPVSYTAPTISNVYDNVLTQKYLSNGSITDDTTPRFSGRGTPNSTIEVRDNDKVIAEVPVDRYGNWSWTATQPLEAGDYRFSFVTVGEDGQEYASADFNLEIISQVTGRITSAEDNVGAVTDPLSSGGRTDDTTPTLNGVGTPDGIVRIYDNNRLIGSAKINESGEWSFTPSSALAAGA
ncbi:Ig-like domain-containing protein, partial [Duffyella gerundensis]|uniref:Ig-like domain-containing protein n=3 Tax=Duffyella gerundensis TaxID=1619313 RepID=UPI00165429A7